jgi:UDP-N-acetylmuramyl tripeptide synthase
MIGNRVLVIDFAHTPAALQSILTAIRQAFPGSRVLTLFGCGGDRDRGKRPMMGAAAARHSDHVIVTSDNPRTEDPRAILDQIVPGILAQGVPAADGRDAAALAERTDKGFAAEPDRRRAIDIGIRAARPGDTVLIAGKGHEPYQIIGQQVIHFDDREEAARVLAELEGTH